MSPMNKATSSKMDTTKLMPPPIGLIWSGNQVPRLVIMLPANEARKRTGPTKAMMNSIDRPRCFQKGRLRLLPQILFRVWVSV